MRGKQAALAVVTLGLAALAGADPLPGATELETSLAKRLVAAADARPTSAIRSQHRAPDGRPLFTNRLVLESSPYLLQHAHNPVNWYAWGDEAFAAARELGRPVLVSIGYATCHWCHVMEKESFDDLAIAEQLNRDFVAIKVDRDLRPDVDAVYLAALEALGRPVGWPVHVWVTSEGEPFFGGSYYPPRDRRGQPGLPRVLETVTALYEDPERVAEDARRWTDRVREALEAAPPADATLPEPAVLLRAAKTWQRRIDPRHGGVGTGRKLPNALPHRFLLRAPQHGDDALTSAVLRSLETMALSGLRDQVGGGFHRATRDAAWRVPEFEKSLTDNARLCLDYLEAWQASGDPFFAEVARDTGEALLRDFALAGGGFASATDAANEGRTSASEAGRFFTWTARDFRAAVGSDARAGLTPYWGIGNAAFAIGDRHILQPRRRIAAWADELAIPPERLAKEIAEGRARLLRERSARRRPLRDAKLVTAWNGLAISAFARAGFALDRPSWVDAAAAAANRVLSGRTERGALTRVQLDVARSGPAFLDDYAFLVAGLLDLYEVSAEPRWLRDALDLQRRLDAEYADPAGGYFRTARAGASPLVREKPVLDGTALPSGNGVAAQNLLRLAALTGDEAYLEAAEQSFRAFGDLLRKTPDRMPALLEALAWLQGAHQEVIVVLPEAGADAGGAEALLAVLRRVHQPQRVQVIVREGEALEANRALVSLLGGKTARDGRATAYVCENRTCRFPTPDPAEFERQLLRAPKRSG